MTSEDERLDEIQGVSFGDSDPTGETVLVDFHIRAYATAGGKEGTRGNVLIATDVLRQVIAALPGILEVMREYGADHDVLPPATKPLPAWNAGPRWNPGEATYHLCTLWGANGMVRELCAVVMVLGAYTPGLHASASESATAEYLMGWSALLALQEALPKVVRKMEQRAANQKGRVH